MAKIPFTLEAWLKDKSRKVETRSGKNVRIICWDKIGVPIVALVGDADDIVTYNRDGTTGQQMQLPSDLFLVTPEPELTEFEQALEILLMNVDSSSQTFHEEVREHATHLFNLARREIIDGWSKGLRDTQDFSGKAYSDGYNLGFGIGYERGKAEALKQLEDSGRVHCKSFDQGYDVGRKEALKDLPRWKKAYREMHVVSRCVVEWEGEIETSNFIAKDSYYMPLVELKNLPKED